MLGKDKHVGEYINNRLANTKDDREDNNKINLDASLRGNIGIKEATKVIEMIDRYKSQR